MYGVIKGNRRRCKIAKTLFLSLALIAILAFFYIVYQSTNTKSNVVSEEILEDHTHGLLLDFDINNHMTAAQQKYKVEAYAYKKNTQKLKNKQKIADETLANTQVWIDKYSHLQSISEKEYLLNTSINNNKRFSCNHYSGCSKVKYRPLTNKNANKNSMKYYYHWKNPPRSDLPSPTMTGKDWLQLHNSQLSTMDHMKDCQNIFIGDSITYGWLHTKPHFNGKYNQELFYNVFGSKSVILGISGDRIEEIGWRLLNGKAYDAIDKCNGHNIVLNVGTNDIGSDERIDVILKEYSILLMQIKIFIDSLNHNNIQRNINVFVVAILSRTDYRENSVQSKVGNIDGDEYLIMKWNENNLYFEIVSVINDFLKDWTLKEENKNRFTFIDCNQYFYEKSDVEEGEKEEKIISSKVMYDFLHLTFEGYQRYAECLNKYQFKGRKI